jgi:hypothetical protein
VDSICQVCTANSGMDQSLLVLVKMEECGPTNNFIQTPVSHEWREERAFMCMKCGAVAHLSFSVTEARVGCVYKHYKTEKYYKVLSIGCNSESADVNSEEAKVVVYQCVYGGRVWVRPKSMFEDLLSWDGQEVRRFQFIAPEDKFDGQNFY